MPLRFENEAVALAAATVAYQGYIETGDEILGDGGLGPERIAPYVTLEMSKAEMTDFAAIPDDGAVYSGSRTAGMLVVQEFMPSSPDGKAILTAYVCVDLSGMNVVDRTGASLVDYSQPDHQTFEVTFDVGDEATADLVVDQNSWWGGEGVCP